MLKLNAIYELIEKMEQEKKRMPEGIRSYSCDVSHETVIQWADEFASSALNKDFINFKTLIEKVERIEDSFERVVHCTFLVILLESNDINKPELFERINLITKAKDGQWSGNYHFSGYYYFSHGIRYINAMMPSVAEPLKDYIAESEAFIDFFLERETSSYDRSIILTNLSQYYGVTYPVNGYQRVATFLKRVVKKNNGVLPEFSSWAINGMLGSFISFGFHEKPKVHDETIYQFSGVACESIRETSSSKVPDGTISMLDIIAYEIFKVPVENRLFDHPNCFLQNFDVLSYPDPEKCSKMLGTIFAESRINREGVEAHLTWSHDDRDILQKEYGRALVNVLIRYFNICNLKNFF